MPLGANRCTGALGDPASFFGLTASSCYPQAMCAASLPPLDGKYRLGLHPAASDDTFVRCDKAPASTAWLEGGPVVGAGRA